MLGKPSVNETWKSEDVTLTRFGGHPGKWPYVLDMDGQMVGLSERQLASLKMVVDKALRTKKPR